MLGIIALILCAPSWLSWYQPLTSIRAFRATKSDKWILGAAPILCLILIAAVLATLSSSDVRTDPLEIASYLALGAAWLGGSSLLFPFLGISARDDVLERSNRAGLWPIVGALAGITFAFADANIGNGPGPAAVIFSAGLSSALFFAIWWAMDAIASFSDSITIDRDKNSGMRLSAALAGIGLLCGWAVSGNWVSLPGTAHDFLLSAWPAVLLGAIATAGEKILQGHREASEKLSPFFVVFYLFLPLVWLTTRGRYV
jgi:hypothetical protein